MLVGFWSECNEFWWNSGEIVFPPESKPYSSSLGFRNSGGIPVNSGGIPVKSGFHPNLSRISRVLGFPIPVGFQ
jgi:hypothetical protein